MTFTYEPTEAAKHVANLEDFGARVESEVTAKVAESPNLLVYGLFCMGVVGWWMQLGQMEAQRFVNGTNTALSYCEKGMNDVMAGYQKVADAHVEAGRRIEQVANEIDSI